MRILVVGSQGYIGGFVVSRLLEDGHSVVGIARRANQQANVRALDLGASLTVDDWSTHLAGVQAVVNCAGILREVTPSSTFEAIHVGAMSSLTDACEQLGVRRVIQISALGNPSDEFIASKHRGDAVIMASSLDWTIFRPSVVYSPHSSYGGTSLLRAMAATPGVLFLPQAGDQPLQPISAEDVGRCVSAALKTRKSVGEVIELVGPKVVTVRRYLEKTRHWLGIKPAHCFKLPLGIVRFACRVGDVTSRGPLGITMFNQLRLGNVGGENAIIRMRALLDIEPEPPDSVLDQNKARAADLFYARAYFVPSALRWVLGLLWLLSGVVGLLTPASVSVDILSPSGLPASFIPLLVLSLSVMDIAVGLWLWFARRPQWPIWFMLMMVCGYTVFVTALIPQLWLEPVGGVLKNIAIIALLGVYLMISERK